MSSFARVVDGLESRFETIRSTPGLPWPLDDAPPPAHAVEIGRSRDGRPIHAYRVGDGGRRVSLIAGCHADEPVGPRLLGRFVPYLYGLDRGDPLVEDIEWWIIPHLNPDGAALNAPWQHPGAEAYDFAEYLPGRVRELPGDDIEFGFPNPTAAGRGGSDGGAGQADRVGPRDEGARPEPAAAAGWWAGADGPFDLHLTLHGMAWAAGPWFLIEPAWIDRTAPLRAYLAERVRELGYRLHDVERHGEKGFVRIERGFATRPDSVAMREHFLALEDLETAARFRPNSMEHIRSLGGDALTLVSEMPLFILPGVGERIGPPDPKLEEWRERIAGWQMRATVAADRRGARGAGDEGGAAGDEGGATGGEAGADDAVATAVRDEAQGAGLSAMPVTDQMRLQWALISAALVTVA